MDKVIIKREIIALANTIKEQADTVFNNTTVSQADLSALSGQIQELNKKVNVLEYLLPIPEAVEAQIISENTIEIQEPLQQTLEPEDEIEEPIFVEPTHVEQVQVKPSEETKPEIPEPINLVPEKPEPLVVKMVIGINDKFQFMNELFGGKLSEYEKTIQQFNNFKTQEEATDYFQKLQELNNWKPNHETVKRLLNLVNNRFK